MSSILSLTWVSFCISRPSLGSVFEPFCDCKCPTRLFLGVPLNHSSFNNHHLHLKVTVLHLLNNFYKLTLSLLFSINYKLHLHPRLLIKEKFYPLSNYIRVSKPPILLGWTPISNGNSSSTFFLNDSFPSYNCVNTSPYKLDDFSCFTKRREIVVDKRIRATLISNENGRGISVRTETVMKQSLLKLIVSNKQVHNKGSKRSKGPWQDPQFLSFFRFNKKGVFSSQIPSSLCNSHVIHLRPSLRVHVLLRGRSDTVLSPLLQKDLWRDFGPSNSFLNDSM